MTTFYQDLTSTKNTTLKMNKRQKNILRDFATVIIVTVLAVAAMIGFKDWVNRSEARQAIEQLGQIVLQYRKEHGSVPPESYIDGIRENLRGRARLGKLNYRAIWIGFESTEDEILAYSQTKSHLLFQDDFIVLRLNGNVEWMNEKKLDHILAKQQTRNEIEMLKKSQ